MTFLPNAFAARVSAKIGGAFVVAALLAALQAAALRAHPAACPALHTNDSAAVSPAFIPIKGQPVQP